MVISCLSWLYIACCLFRVCRLGLSRCDDLWLPMFSCFVVVFIICCYLTPMWLEHGLFELELGGKIMGLLLFPACVALANFYSSARRVFESLDTILPSHAMQSRSLFSWLQHGRKGNHPPNKMTARPLYRYHRQRVSRFL